MLFRGVCCRFLSFAVGAAGIVCLSLCTNEALAGDSHTSETCPSRSSIEAAVQALLGKSLIASEDLNQIDVVDLGDHYVITAKERMREYTDEARDCAKRARVAAVFVALTLAPPEIGSASGAASPKVEGPEPEVAPPILPAPPPIPVPVGPPSKPATPPLPARMSRAWRPGVELGTRVALAPRGDKSLVDLGGQVQFILTSLHWGVTFGANVPAPSTLEIESVRVQQARYSGIFGVRLSWRSDQIRAAVDLCALAALLRLQRLDSTTAYAETRVEPGLHLGTTWALRGDFLSPYVGGYAELIPFTIPIAVEPRGIIGHTSAVWLGLVAGIAMGTY